MTIKEKILAYLDFKGIKRGDFFESLGIAASNFKGNAKTSELGGDKIAKILTSCPDLSAEWLMTGVGEMLKTKCTSVQQKDQLPPISNGKNSNKSPKSKDFDTEIIDNIAHRVPEGSKEGIPLIPIEAMAGALTSEQTVLEYECERYVIPVFKGADFLIPVKGSSMYPKYSSGDIVACQRVPMSDLFFQWNKVYVIDTTQGPLIKRIKPGSDKEHILIVSDNEKYDPFELPYSAIRAVALVIGVIRLE